MKCQAQAPACAPLSSSVRLILKRYCLTVGLLITTSTFAVELEQVKGEDLANVVAFGSVLAEREGVRIVLVPRQIGECWGSVSSCPDVDAYVSYHSGDLEGPPRVFRLPVAKGWVFGGWQGTDTFVLKTALPDANVDGMERKTWRSTTYLLKLNEEVAEIVAQ